MKNNTISLELAQIGFARRMTRRGFLRARRACAGRGLPVATLDGAYVPHGDDSTIGSNFCQDAKAKYFGRIHRKRQCAQMTRINADIPASPSDTSPMVNVVLVVPEILPPFGRFVPFFCHWQLTVSELNAAALKVAVLLA